MRILIYTIFYPAPPEMHTRQDTLVVHYFAKALQRKGHRVQVVHMNCDNLPALFKNRFQGVIPKVADYEYDGVPVHLIRITTLTPFQGDPQRFQAALINRDLRALKRRLGWKPDKVFVHFPTLFTGIDEIFADGAPVLGDFHNIDIRILNKRYLTKRHNQTIADFIRRLDHWGYRNLRVQAGLRAIQDRAMVRTLSGIDDFVLSPPEFIREKAARQREEARIVYVGQLIPLKHVDVLIEAVKRLSFPWELTVVGDGPERGRLEALAGDSPHIRFTGRLPREEAVARMEEADVFVMLSRPETYGLVYLEAMARGCVTVASRGEGFDGLIDDGENGFLAEPESVEAAVAVLERVHALTAEQRRAMIQRGYDLARSMTEDQTAQKFLDDNT